MNKVLQSSLGSVVLLAGTFFGISRPMSAQCPQILAEDAGRSALEAPHYSYGLFSFTALAPAVYSIYHKRQIASGSEFRLVRQEQCWQRIGPFATQDTAWRRWREARDAGYRVSNGVVPCYDEGGGRGYCFNVFYDCQ